MSQVPPQEADILVHENRFLKQTILSLRDELVMKEQEQENLLQSSLSKLANENLQLKSSVESLRERLDQSIAQHEDERQKLVREKSKDVENLQQLVKSLRSELEQSEIRHEALGQKTLLLSKNEIPPSKEVFLNFGKNWKKKISNRRKSKAMQEELPTKK